MKTLFVVLTGILALGTQAATAAPLKPFKAEYTLSGHCEEQFWIDEGNGNGHWDSKVLSSKNSPGDLAGASIDGFGGAMVSTGPSDDGAGGCAVFKAMLDCKTGKGTFQVDDGDAGIFHTPPAVTNFSCAN